MFKYLQRIFGKSSSSYESLMDSRDPEVEISESSINQVVEALRPIILKAHLLELKNTVNLEAPKLPVGTSWPVNKKGIPLLYLGTVSNENSKCAIFQHADGMKKDESNIQIINLTGHNEESLEMVQSEREDFISKQSYEMTACDSLPIWEEIIHRAPAIHKLIVKLAPNNPWTLYKRAKKELCGTVSYEQLGGYPQWTVNDVDYRKIKNAEFNLQITDLERQKTYYLFTNDNQIERFFQVL